MASMLGVKPSWAVLLGGATHAPLKMLIKFWEITSTSGDSWCNLDTHRRNRNLFRVVVTEANGDTSEIGKRFYLSIYVGM